jgi:hypothetical protein
LTDLADRILRGIRPTAPKSFTGEARLFARHTLDRSFVLLRSAEPDARAEARRLLDDLSTRVEMQLYDEGSPPPDELLLDSNIGETFLSDLAVAYSRLGEEERAVEISLRLLEHARVVGSNNMISTQLNNLGVRRSKLAFFTAAEGDLGGAVNLLRRAREHHIESLMFRPDMGDSASQASRLLAESHRFAVDVELAVLDADERRGGDGGIPDSQIQHLAAEGLDLVRRSYANASVAAGSRVIRAARLGVVKWEESRGLARKGAQHAAAIAMLARVLMQAQFESFGEDVDIAFPLALRYGDACVATGWPETALRVFSRGLRSAEATRGAESGLAGLFRKRLDMLQG